MKRLAKWCSCENLLTDIYYECFSCNLQIITSLSSVTGFCLSRGVFACVESCSLQVTGSIHINSPLMGNKGMIDHLMNPHNITMKEVITFLNLNCISIFYCLNKYLTIVMCIWYVYLQGTLSTVNSRPSINRALASSKPSANSSTLLNKATVDSPRDMVRVTHTVVFVHPGKFKHAHKITENIHLIELLCYRSSPGRIISIFSVSAESKPTVWILPIFPGRPWSADAEAVLLWTGTWDVLT